MSFSAHIWNQLKNLSADELIGALLKDQWEEHTSCGSQHVYLKDGRRVSVHYHPGKTFGPGLLKGLLNDTGWTESDFRRLKLIK